MSYLILAILCTSLDAYEGYSTKLFCIVMTGRCCCCRQQRISNTRGDVESNEEDNLNNDTSESSVDGQNWRDVVDDEDDDEDFGDSNVAAVDSNFSGLNWKPTDETKDDEDVTQTSTGLALNSASLESDNHPVLTQSESDVLLNKNDSYAEEKTKALTPYQHNFPRKPDFLDMCCAGDPLKLEKHLEQPVQLQKTKAGGEW